MIIITLGCLLTILVCFSIGTGFVDLYGKVTGRTEAYSFIETLLIGLCVTGSIVCISSIWLPSGTQLAIVLAILSVFYIAIFKLNNIVSQVRRLKKDNSISVCFNIGNTPHAFFIHSGSASVPGCIYIPYPKYNVE